MNLRKNLLVDTMFLINSIVSTLPFTIIIFFLLDISVTEENISLLFSLKFWGVSAFSFLFVPLSKSLSIKNIITTSVIIRLVAYLYFFIDQSFFGAIILVILNSLSASLFTTASKIHIQNTSHNISLSLSRRFTLNNIGVSITPMFLVAINKVEHIIIICIALSIFLLLLTLMLSNSDNYVNQEQLRKEKINLDKKLLSLIFISCLLFSIFYLTYEKNIPILLERRNVFIAIGISLSSWILTLEKYIPIIILILLMILGWLVKKVKKAV